jgi:hypothetical protein
MSSDVVMIANKSYIIKQSLGDSARRRVYFNTFKENSNTTSGSLTADESKLLADLGINSKMIMNLKLYLPTFFDNLQMCSSDTSLVLRKDCNIPYYVLWSIMFANKQATDERIRANKEAYYSSRNIGVAMNTAIVSQMRRKNIRDEYDKVFELLLTQSVTLKPVAVEFNESLFQLPRASNDKEQLARNDLTNVNIEYAKFIPEIFTLILTKPGVSGVPSILSELKKLVENRPQPPLYTFSQLGNTCASDALFTILLQADNLRDIFVNNAQKIKDETIDATISHALLRYERMLELEAKHVKNTLGKSRRPSLNLDTRHGEAILKGISGEDSCIGLTKKKILDYMKDIQQKLKSHGIIQRDEELNVFIGDNFITFINNETSNLNSIKGIYLHIPGNISETEITSTGHAIACVKIYNEWYITDNEFGILHKIDDPHLINILLLNLYKQRQFTIRYEKGSTADNLAFKFEFFDDENNIVYTVYTYPANVTFNQDKVVSSPITPSRIILFTHEIKRGDDDTFMNKILNYFDKNVSDYTQNEIKTESAQD